MSRSKSGNKMPLLAKVPNPRSIIIEPTIQGFRHWLHTIRSSQSKAHCGNAITKASGNAECCLELRLPTSGPIAITDIHFQLLKSQQLTGYQSCTSVDDAVHVFFETPMHAKDNAGKHITDLGLLEYTDCYSTVFVCKDVHGLPTRTILENLDRQPVAAEMGIGLRRQEGNGPLIAIEFEQPLSGHYSGFDLNILNSGQHICSLRFDRASFKCELCSTHNDHPIKECDRITVEKELSRPDGFMVHRREELKQIGLLEDAIPGTEASAILDDTIQENRLLIDTIINDMKTAREKGQLCWITTEFLG